MMFPTGIKTDVCHYQMSKLVDTIWTYLIFSTMTLYDLIIALSVSGCAKITEMISILLLFCPRGNDCARYYQAGGGGGNDRKITIDSCCAIILTNVFGFVSIINGDTKTRY